MCLYIVPVIGSNSNVDIATTVTVDAPLYDTRLRADNGCNPAGCSGDLTTVSGGKIPVSSDCTEIRTHHV